MREIVADIAEDATAVDCNGCVPVIEEDEVSKVPERGGEDEEECGRHDESVAVHG